MKRRNLSGVFIFHQFEGESKRQPTCFEDCPEEKQNEWLDTLDKEAIKNLSKILAKTLREVGEFCDVAKGGDDE